MSDGSHELLTQQLAGLLGMGSEEEEYVSDVLGSLVEVADNPGDVAEYLSSFGCMESDVLLRFAENLRRYKHGEDISPQKNDGNLEAAVTETKNQTDAPSRVLDEAASEREEIKRRELEAKERQAREEERWRLKKKEEEERKTAAKVRAKSTKAPKPTTKNASGTNTKGHTKQTASRPTSSTKAKPAASVSKSTTPAMMGVDILNEVSQIANKAPLKKAMFGKPKNPECGCFGQKYAPLTNCLNCGRISCEAEGYDYCHFCGFLIEDFSKRANVSESAQMHKERLLEFDRTSASRTHVHDDQEDYFVTSTNMFATESEQADARAMEEERRRKLHERQKQKLEINF
ncbi:hypothetical protein THAOC_36124 [Thalassiosira oceanica]|uniref:TRIP4/RQT4 C2HC5-type zinc finger domain-containing protein n=1 Tax=Thalassiosira oceanica TaxID=159749 RepID=K0R8Y0_THAOC|nr:hypothetical protein THAOC_36124 [Thalassiosira oceanica]|eukprot:EJK45266.1 hypothetical protein THAOC_36124 [Thalassiosira oceanica]